MDITQYFKNVKEEKKIWVPIHKAADVFYPKDGNKNFAGLEDNSFWYKHRNDCIEIVIKSFPPQTMVFDIGGGNGYVSTAIKKAGYQPVIVEPDIEGVYNAQKRGFKDLVNASLQDLEILPESIPAIGIFDVIEHIEKDGDFLNTLNSSLISKGKLYLTVPAYNSLWSNEDVHDGHFRRYTKRTMVQLLEENNFSIVYSSYIFSFLPAPIFFLRTIPSWFSKTKQSFEEESAEHSAGIFANIFDRVFRWELSRIKKKKHLSFGGSLLIVAEKK